MKVIESSSESILPHWPNRQEFLKQQQEFVESYRSTILEQFAKEKIPQEIVSDLVDICLRVMFVKQIMVEKTKIDEKIDIDLTWEKKVTERFRAGIVPKFFVRGEPFTDYGDLYKAAQENIDEIELNGANIFINLQEIIESLEQSVIYYSRHLELNAGDIKGAEQLKEEMIEELAIKTELSLVHELSHALFFHSVFSHKKKFLRWLEEHQGYDARDLKQDELIPIYSEEEMNAMRQNYNEKRIEKAGDVLPLLFKKKYYPDSRVTI